MERRRGTLTQRHPGAPEHGRAAAPPRRRVVWGSAVACVVLALVLSDGHPVGADGSLYVPLSLQRSAPEPVIAVDLPDLEWSVVLRDVPVPAGFRLDYFDAGAVPDRSEARADYAPIESAPRDVLAWYRLVLPRLRWQLAGETPQVQRWRRGDRWLEVHAPAALDLPWLHLACAPDCVRPVEGTTVDGVALFPPGARRQRYDRADLFPEEAWVGAPVDRVRTDVVTVLAAAGWQALPVETVGPATVLRVVRGEVTLLVAIRSLDDAGAEVAVGRIDCLASRHVDAEWPQPDESVYLTAVPAPPEARIVRYLQRADIDLATEGWSSACLDLDLFAAMYLERLTRTGWTVPNAPVRGPGRWSLEARPGGDGPAVAVTVSASAAGSAFIELSRTIEGRRQAVGRSLLFGDLPVPSGADAVRMESSTPAGWTFRETYVPPLATVTDVAAFYRRSMPVSYWAYDRLEPPDVGPAQVYAHGGVEVLIGFPTEAEDVPAISLASRRVCPSDDVAPPAGAGAASPHLAEVPIFPGAVLDVFEADQESYHVTCVNLDVLAGWYRAALERGTWALASTVGPEDAHHRELLFVRPDERGLPPERRTGWVDVRLDRVWPYQYRLTLRRDANGIRPAPHVR